MIAYSVSSYMVSGTTRTEVQITDNDHPVFTDLLRTVLDDVRSRLELPPDATTEYKIGRAVMGLQPGWELRIPDYSPGSQDYVQIRRDV